jgi:serpin B
MMYLINTLYMHAKWADAFRPMDESTRTFTPENGVPQQVPFLTASGRSGTSLYASVAQTFDCIYEAVLLPYDDSRLGFLMVRPTDDRTVRQLAQIIDLSEVFAGLTLQRGVAVHMPELDVDFEICLIETLRAMGLEDAFCPDEADLLGLVEWTPNNLVISKVQQIVRMLVDSEGTEAAAVTIIEIMPPSVPPPPQFILDFNTPYIYAILDLETGIPLFIGIVDEVRYA